MSLSEKLKKAAVTAKEINDLNQQATELIIRVNKFLLEHHIGVTKWLTTPMKDDKHYLGVDRTGEKNQMVLAVRNTLPLPNFAYHPKPLMDCDRELRLIAAAQISQLLDEIIKELDREKTIAESSREAILKLRDKLN